MLGKEIGVEKKEELNKKFRIAFSLRHYSEAEELLLSGADINYFDINSKIDYIKLPALLMAINEVNIEKIKWLVAKKASASIIIGPFTVLHEAAKNLNPEIIELLVKNGAKIDGKTIETGKTPLHAAVIAGKKSNVIKLIELGAGIDVADKEGKTALHYAVLDFDEHIVSVLLTSKAKVDCVDNAGKTPLHYAAENYDAIIIGILLANKASKAIKDENGNTPLFSALFYPRDINAEEGLRKAIMNLLNEKMPEENTEKLFEEAKKEFVKYCEITEKNDSPGNVEGTEQYKKARLFEKKFADVCKKHVSVLERDLYKLSPAKFKNDSGKTERDYIA